MLVDYSTLRPPMATLKAAGVTAVGRYLGWDCEPGYACIRKNIARAEAEELHKAGIAVFLAFEYDPQVALKGAAQGRADARLAARQLHDLGASSDMTVYFALDFDIRDYAPGSNDPKLKLGPAADYFEAIRATRPTYKVGVYGGYWAVSRVLDAKLADMAWQTIAWSGGQWDKRARIRQLARQVFGEADVNLHAAAYPDFGQWPRPAQLEHMHRHLGDGTQTWGQLAASRGTTVRHLLHQAMDSYHQIDYDDITKLPVQTGFPYYLHP